jgi:hypothetical protein
MFSVSATKSRRKSWFPNTQGQGGSGGEGILTSLEGLLIRRAKLGLCNASSLRAAGDGAMAAFGSTSARRREMTQRRLQRTAAAAVLAAALGLAAPAQAMGWTAPAAGPAWLETALHWVAQHWPGAAERHKSPNTKSDKGGGIDPNGGYLTPPPPVTTSGDKGGGIDPNG